MAYCSCTSDGNNENRNSSSHKIWTEDFQQFPSTNHTPHQQAKQKNPQPLLTTLKKDKTKLQNSITGIKTEVKTIKTAVIKPNEKPHVQSAK